MKEAQSEELVSLFSSFESYSKDNKILMYKTIIKSMSSDIESIYESTDYNKLLGHKIKGTSEMIGANKLTCLAEKFELSRNILNFNNMKDSLVKEMLDIIETAKYKLEILINEK